MTSRPMHPDEITVDADLVRRLLASQFPQWAALEVAPVDSAGTDHALYRLGADMGARLPRRPGVVSQVEKEHAWLPRLAPALPLAIPEPLALARPSEAFPYLWSVYRWLPGATLPLQGVARSPAVARQLADFIAALQRIHPTGGPQPGAHNGFRGAALAVRDERTRASIAELDAIGGLIDNLAVLEAWRAALDAPAWHGAPVWLHGDLLPSNLLVDGGRLTGVIDFGMVGVGDPAYDLMAAWTTFEASARPAFRGELTADDATWARARGWTLSWALTALPYYLETNPTLVEVARHAITEVLADVE